MKCFNLSVIATFCLATLSAADCSAGDPVIVASGKGANTPSQPQVAVGSEGSVHLVYGTGDAVQYCQSLDGGTTFGKAMQAFRVPNMSLGMRRGPRVVKTKDAIVITAIGGQIGKGRDGDVVAWRSMDDGKTWKGPVRVNDTADSAREGLHAMTSGLDGSIWCVWLDLRDKKSEIYATVSKDNGATWEANQCVYRSPDGSVCECCHPSVVVSGNCVHVMFRNSIDGDRDMYVASSKDDGKSFSPVRNWAQEHGRWTPARWMVVCWRPVQKVCWKRSGGAMRMFMRQQGMDRRKFFSVKDSNRGLPQLRRDLSLFGRRAAKVICSCRAQSQVNHRSWHEVGAIR